MKSESTKNKLLYAKVIEMSGNVGIIVSLSKETVWVTEVEFC